MDVEEVLKLIPNSHAHHLDSALAIHKAMLMVRAIMREHFGIDPQVTKRAEHVEFALRLLASLFEGARAPSGPASPAGRGARKSAARDGAELLARDERRRRKLVALLREHRGNVSEVARAMSKARNQIVRWIERYQLDPDVYREE